MKFLRVPVLVAFLLSGRLAVYQVNAQSGEKINLDVYYHSPVSLGVAYLPLSGMGNRALADFDIQDISGEIRLSPENFPVFQPFLRGGMLNYVFLGDLDTALQDWTHTHFYAGAGLGFSTRISREFEFGSDIFAAASQSYFAALTLEGTTAARGQFNLVSGASARLALNPSFKLCIGITPSLRYVYGLGPLDTYNGLVFGVGFGASYRFGQDPDAVQNTVRAIRFTKTEVPPLFAAMQSYYARGKAGTVVITNSGKYTISDLQLSFMQAGFMDSPTPCLSLDSMEPGEAIEVPVLASFNDQVFSTQGVTALTGEFIVQYTAKGRPVEQRHSVTYDLYDKNALTWDDDRKAAAFITPQDSAVRNYASFIRQIHKDITNPFLSKNLQFAMQAYDALAELGIMYQVDPTSPFTEVQEDTFSVDSISLPRETLQRRTGDCDDLTVLFNTLLQSVGIQTALVTTPGHIYSAFNTEIPAHEYQRLHPDRRMFMEVDGQLWVLVEITLIGMADFMRAWNTGVSEFRLYDTNTRVRGFYRTAEAQDIFRPISLRETDLGLQYGESSRITRKFSSELSQLMDGILKPYAEKAEGSNSVRDWNAYGVAAAQLGAESQARLAFERCLEIDPANINAKLNIGSILYLGAEYSDALSEFKAVETIIESKGTASRGIQTSLFLNLSMAHYSLEQYEQARIYYDKAQAVNPEAARRFDYLKVASSVGNAQLNTNRASEAAMAEPILFFED
ncbi:MAG: hypothetical protein ABIJ86_13660 [Spirochaetota bacterium]